MHAFDDMVGCENDSIRPQDDSGPDSSQLSVAVPHQNQDRRGRDAFNDLISRETILGSALGYEDASGEKQQSYDRKHVHTSHSSPPISRPTTKTSCA
jgi:hypothetical protein